MARVDGKYEVLRELSREENTIVQEAISPEGQSVRLVWFDVHDPATRALFHRYRSALRAVGSIFLVDVVARPGAYYSVWLPPSGTPLEEYLGAPVKDEATVDAVRTVAEMLAEHGFALPDAQIFLEDGRPQLAALKLIDRPLEEIASLNRELLSALDAGRRRPRRRPKPAASARPPRDPARPRLTWLGVLPGLLFLGGAGYLGAQAVSIYLNPPTYEVPGVVGEEANKAALELVSVTDPRTGREVSGFRVAFVDGEEAGKPQGVVLAQQPPPGSALHAGRLVTLTVNNPPPLNVPKLSDLSVAEARAALKEANLGVGKLAYTYVQDGSVPKGHVIAQYPEAGVQVGRGQKVSLLLSSGERVQETFLPDLTGLSFDEARVLVEKAGLVVTRTESVTSERSEGTVLSQTPKPFAKVEVGSPVVLGVARAPLAEPPRQTVPTEPLGPVPQPEPEPAPTPQPEPTPAPQPEPTPTPQPEATPAPTPSPQTPAAPQAGVPRTLNFDFTFPSDLPEGEAELRVIDENGEQTLVRQPNAAGLPVSVEVTVTGRAVFRVMVNGQAYQSFER
ncbi:beta-lactam-binding protein with PASTA domain [Deinobacterium chartae]|uniref:Beta-lactam-binding protein with PASTA domain n=1 Tax=Deinobacterium chartae TaxID=521158 RepID=A0A841HYZ7_9DEIO|nr:PASTA domain-containing protein [Deinobacterium chartae]MBB6097440.1 beta-lactam-binding protein with PASTA domain [Deinobacterium chartae]